MIKKSRLYLRILAGLVPILFLLMVQNAAAVTLSVQDAGAGAGCPNAWPVSIVGNYVENGTWNGNPRYDSSGWYIYRVNIWGADNWVVSNTLGSADYNNSTIAFYQTSSAATPPQNSGYFNTNSACGKISIVSGGTATPPPAPTIYNFNAGMPPYISGGSTTVYWSAVTGAMGYHLDVATDASFTTFLPGYNNLAVTGSPTPPTFITVSGLTNPGTTYYFRVRAYNSVGDSGNSGTISTTAIPAAPTATPASGISGYAFQANWNAQTGASYYKLYVCTDLAFSTCVSGFNPSSVSGTSASVTGLSAGTTYHYRLRASNENGDSGVSNTISLATNSLPVLGGSFTTAGAVNDNSTIAPFSGVTVSDANGDNVSVIITYAAANGTLTGTGLSGSAGNYVRAAATPAAATTNLQALVFHPTLHQAAPGSTVVTTFSLTPNDGMDDGATNSATVVTTTMVNTAPVFAGAATTLTVNANSGANDVKGLLHAGDPDAGQTLTWSQQTLPIHGTLVISGATAGSGSADITPGGTVTYQPTGGYSGSDSFTVQVSDGISSATRTITVSVNQAPAVTNANNTTFTVGVAGTFSITTTGYPVPAVGETGSLPAGVIFTDNGNGTATLAGTPAAGTNGVYNLTITASNGVSPNATQNFTLTVNKASTATTVISAPNPSVFGQSVTFTATAVAVPSAAGTPTGTVTFLDGAASLGSATLAGGTATLSSSTLTAGSHSITAVYNGDSGFATSTSSILTQTVSQASTTTTVISAPNPSVFGQSVTFTATAAAVPPAAGTPTGTVTFLDGAASLGSATLTGGTATLSSSSLTTGGHSITAVYNGDSSFTTSTSSTITQTVNNAGTITAITGDTPDPSSVGQAVTASFTVSVVAPGSGTPTGNVTVSDGVDSCTGSVAAGSCSLALATAGPRTLTATYAGDASFSGSTSVGEPHDVCISAITVANINDSGAGSLRQAIADICPGGTIDFAAALSGLTITLEAASGPLELTRDMTISGPGSANLTISGGGLVSVFLVNSGVTFNLNDLTVANGRFVTPTSGIATAPGGGAIRNISGTVNIQNCTFLNNSAVSNSGTYGALGGAINNVLGTMNILNSAFSGNSATSTIVDAGEGGAISNLGTMNIQNSTSSGNAASTSGGAIINLGTLTVTHSTISGNSAGSAGSGIGNSTGTLTVTGSILAANAGGNCSGTITDAGNNVDDGTACGFGLSSLSNTDPLLDAAGLQDNGGPTQTIALLPGSPAIDAISAGTGGCGTTVITDQRGIARPQNGACDIGAYESRGFTFGAPTGTPQTAAINTAFAAPLGVAVTSAFGEPVDGGVLTFTAPPGGPSVTFAPVTTAAISAGAVSLGAVANGTVGGPYNVSTTANGVAGTALFILVNDTIPTTTSVSSSANPGVYGQSISFTATVAAVSGTPTGTVTFMDGAVTLGTGSVDVSGQAVFTAVAFSPGSHSITAVYSGDTSYTASTSSALTQLVNQSSTTTTVGSAPNPSVVNQTVAVTYTVTANSPGSGIATGSVTVTDGVNSCTSTVAAGSCNLTFTSSGTKSLVATYAGDTNFNGSVSSVAAHTVNKAGTAVMITSHIPDPSVVGQAVAVTYTVGTLGGSGTVSTGSVSTGNVTVSDGVNSCTGTVAAGSCSITLTTPGTRTLAATYAGDVNFMASTSSGVSHTVGKAATTATITSDTPDPSVAGQAVTVSYTVTPVAPGSGTPTGNVTVSDGVNSCTGTVAAGSCSITLTTPGTRTLTATYAGDASFNGSSGTAAHAVRLQHLLGVSVSGSGTVTGNMTGVEGNGIHCGADCSETYNEGTSVTLSAAAASGWKFSGWSGDPDCADGQLSVNNPRNCVATFVLNNGVTIPAATGNGDITLVTNSPGCGFTSWGAKTEAQVGTDVLFDYPYGLVEFTLNCAAADVTITFPGSIVGSTYRKYGPTTPGSPSTTVWYTLGSVTGNGNNSVTLHLKDGQLGDDTGVDGIIVDQGGPGQQGGNGAVAVPTMTDWGMIFFMLCAGLASVYHITRRRA